MKVKVKTKDLKVVVSVLKKSNYKKQNYGILEGVLLTATKNKLQLETTNLETSVKINLNAEVIVEGSVLIPLKRLESILKVNKEETLMIESEEIKKEEMVIKTKVKLYKLSLNAMDKAEFPKKEVLTGKGIRIADFISFVEALKAIEDFTSRDEYRPILEGIMLDRNKLVATDSYKLAEIKLLFDIGNSIVFTKDIVKILESIMKVVLKDVDEPFFDIIIKENKESKEIGFNVTGEDFRFNVITRDISGKFPDYERLIPLKEKAGWKYQVESKELIKLIEEADKLVELTKFNIPIKLKFNNGEIEVLGNVKEVGDYKDVLKSNQWTDSIFYKVYNSSNKEVHSTLVKEQAQNWIKNEAMPPEGADTDKEEIKVHYTIQESTELVTAFNPYFLKTCLKNFSEPMLNLYDPLKPMLITEEGSNMKVIIMPIRVE